VPLVLASRSTRACRDLGPGHADGYANTLLDLEGVPRVVGHEDQGGRPNVRGGVTMWQSKRNISCTLVPGPDFKASGKTQAQEKVI
jgi:hypothetical protein